jgi:hypothetical protein
MSVASDDDDGIVVDQLSTTAHDARVESQAEGLTRPQDDD